MQLQPRKRDQRSVSLKEPLPNMSFSLPVKKTCHRVSLKKAIISLKWRLPAKDLCQTKEYGLRTIFKMSFSLQKRSVLTNQSTFKQDRELVGAKPRSALKLRRAATELSWFQRLDQRQASLTPGPSLMKVCSISVINTSKLEWNSLPPKPASLR